MEWMNIRKVGNLLYNFHFGDANRSENTDDFDINICVEGVQVSKLNVEHYQTYSSSIADLHLRHDDYGPDFIWRYTDPDNVKTMTPLIDTGKRPTISAIRKRALWESVFYKKDLKDFNEAFTTIATERGLMWTI